MGGCSSSRRSRPRVAAEIPAAEISVARANMADAKDSMRLYSMFPAAKTTDGERDRSRLGLSLAELKLFLWGPIALLDAAWLVDLADSGGIISHRQALPQEAFIDVHSFFRDKNAVVNTTCGDVLRVILLSYPWLHPSHPDQHGETLRLVANLLRAFMNGCRGTETWALFWDYPCLFQHPDPANQHFRSEEEEGLFKRGLNGLATLYAHQFTWVLRSTKFPSGYPEQYQLPTDANVLPYYQRGWTFTESSWASMTKDNILSLDIGAFVHKDGMDRASAVKMCTADRSRSAPLVPADFEDAVAVMHFTNGKDDRPLCTRLYKEVFVAQFSKVHTLIWVDLGWKDADMMKVGKLFATGVLTELVYLNISMNVFGDSGAAALMKPIQEGCLPKLKAVWIEMTAGERFSDQTVKSAKGIFETRGILLDPTSGW